MLLFLDMLLYCISYDICRSHSSSSHIFTGCRAAMASCSSASGAFPCRLSTTASSARAVGTEVERSSGEEMVLRRSPSKDSRLAPSARMADTLRSSAT